MAIKTFTTGEVLTASDTNTYLANSGLVYVTSTTIGSAVSSVTITNVFSSTYDNYRIMVSGSVATNADSSIRVRPGNDTTAGSYFSGGLYVKYDGTSPGYVVNNGTTTGIEVALTDTTNTAFAFDLMSPNLATHTRTVSGICAGTQFTSAYSGVHKVATAYTSITIAVASGTLTGGTITVMGYRKA
jgi:hypothetical protein